jgi:hypothetical protein
MEKADRARGYGIQHIEVFISDHGGEFTSNVFEKFCSDRGITHFTGPKNTPNYNAHQERHIRTINEKMNALLKDLRLSSEFWPLMRDAEVYLTNRSVSKRNNEYCTPFELYFGYTPDLKNLRAIGSVCFANVDKQERSALEDRAVKGIFVGYDEKRRAYRVLPDGLRNYIVSRSVTFDETSINKSMETGHISEEEEDDTEDIILNEEAQRKIEVSFKQLSEKKKRKVDKLKKQLAYGATYDSTTDLIGDCPYSFLDSNACEEHCLSVVSSVSAGTGHDEVSWEDAMNSPEKDKWL